MKKLGLIGGMGPESTLSYYHGINYGYQSRNPQGSFPPLVLESVYIFEMLSFCRSKDYDGLTAFLLRAIQNTAAAGADFAALAANTPHIVYDRLQALSPLPLLSIVETTYREARLKGMGKLGLLGTAFTMEEDFFKKKFEENGISVAVPGPAERFSINSKIINELEFGVVKESTREEFLGIIRRMMEEDRVEGVILGCTELPLLFQGTPLPLPCLDTMELHISGIVDMILEQY